MWATLPLLALLALSAAHVSWAQTDDPVSQALSQAPAGDGNACTDAALARLNAWRASVNASALTKDVTLTNRAQRRAELAAGKELGFDFFTQDPQVANVSNSIDDLGFMITNPSRAYSCDMIIDNWVAGYQYYPRDSATPYQDIYKMDEQRRTDVLYYVQLVWLKTTQMGCGISTQNANVVVYCYFNPAGGFPYTDPAFIANVPPIRPTPPGMTPGTGGGGGGIAGGTGTTSFTKSSATAALLSWSSMLLLLGAALAALSVLAQA